MSKRGLTLLEMLTVVAMLAMASTLFLITPFRSYMHARAARDAATTMAQDIAWLERIAQNGGVNDGATLQVDSINPLVYDCYYGRPNALDPNSTLGPLIVHRSFDDVALIAGPIDASTPLLFADNGSVQYVSAGLWADQHQTVDLTLAPSNDPSQTTNLQLDLFTGGVARP